MRRLLVLGTVIIVGALSITAVAAQAPAGPSAAALAATKIEKVRDNLYIITGSGAETPQAFSGGNSAVFVTDAGVVLVDTKLPGWGPTVLDRIKSVTNKPVTTVINTHTHGDHTGSNEFFGATIESVVHENTKANMARMPAFASDKARFLPRRTYKDRLTLGTGKDRIELYYFGAGHTSGDTFVVFPAVRAVHTGDMFAWKALPLIDTGNGGSAVGHAQTLAAAASAITGVETVITGHTPLLAFEDLREYASFSADFVAFGRAALKAGKTVDQAAAEYTVPARYKGYIATVNPEFASAKSNLQALYDELRR